MESKNCAVGEEKLVDVAQLGRSAQTRVGRLQRKLKTISADLDDLESVLGTVGEPFTRGNQICLECRTYLDDSVGHGDNRLQVPRRLKRKYEIDAILLEGTRRFYQWVLFEKDCC